LQLALSSVSEWQLANKINDPEFIT
jgi:hypothetical protein